MQLIKVFIVFLCLLYCQTATAEVIALARGNICNRIIPVSVAIPSNLNLNDVHIVYSYSMSGSISGVNTNLNSGCSIGAEGVIVLGLQVQIPTGGYVGIGGDDETLDLGFFAGPGKNYEVTKSAQIRESQLSTDQLQLLSGYQGQTLTGYLGATCQVNFAQSDTCGANSSLRARRVSVALE